MRSSIFRSALSQLTILGAIAAAGLHCGTETGSAPIEPSGGASSGTVSNPMPTGTTPPPMPTTPPAPKPPPVKGFADLHVHMMAENAFGGGWLHGSHTGVLRDCDGGFPPSDHGRVRQDISDVLKACPNSSSIPWTKSPLLSALAVVGGSGASEYIGKMEGTLGDTGVHLQRTKANVGFPRWDTIAHQQAMEGWLKTAHDKGLSLMVMSAVSFKWLCELMPAQNRKRACSEVADIDVQLDQTAALVQRNPWVEIALTPADARRIIQAGKLALVLSIEASNIFDESADWKTLFDRFYAKGVRTMQIVHHQDNRFAGAALHNPIFQLAQYTRNCKIDTDCGATVDGMTLGFDVDAQCRNTKGMTVEGLAFVGEMMKRGMPIDIAHLSERGTNEVFEVVKGANYYPLYISHGHFREVMNPDLASNEKTTPKEVIRMLRQTGGMFGLRTAHDETRTYTRASVPNDCQGSTKSFAQAFEFGAKELKVSMGLGSDFNGFIQNTRPRFGTDGACSAGFPAEATAQRALQKSPVGTEFDTKGLAHIGLVPDMLKDMKTLGVDTSPLDDSAERYIQMWERASSVRTGWADDAANMTADGVAPYVPKDQRGY